MAALARARRGNDSPAISFVDAKTRSLVDLDISN
jgi:hypothetical protein